MDYAIRYAIGKKLQKMTNHVIARFSTLSTGLSTPDYVNALCSGYAKLIYITFVKGKIQVILHEIHTYGKRTPARRGPLFAAPDRKAHSGRGERPGASFSPGRLQFPAHLCYDKEEEIYKTYPR